MEYSEQIFNKMGQGEIVLYQPDDSLRLEVRLDGDNVWLNRSQLAELFDRDVKTIGKHINNALKEELDNVPVVAKFATTAADGKFIKLNIIILIWLYLLDFE